MHLGLNFHDVAQALEGAGREQPARRAGATDPVARQPLPAIASRFSPSPAGSLGLTVLLMFTKPPGPRGGGGWGLGPQSLREEGLETRTPRSEEGVAHGAVHERHPVAAEFPARVRRRRPRLRARCEGGADGEEEGVGGGPRPLPNPGPSPESSPWRPKKAERAQLHTFLGPGNEFLGLPRRVPVRTTSPSGPRTSPFTSEEPRSPGAAGSCSFLSHQAEAARRPLVDKTPRSLLHRSKRPHVRGHPPTFSPPHHLSTPASLPNSVHSNHADLLAVLPAFTTEGPLFTYPPRTHYGRREVAIMH